jgi:type VI protein secretion system component Hcp
MSELQSFLLTHEARIQAIFASSNSSSAHITSTFVNKSDISAPELFFASGSQSKQFSFVSNKVNQVNFITTHLENTEEGI